MRFALGLIATVCACAQSSIVLQPAVITKCSPDGMGSAVAVWKASTSPVSVRVGETALANASPAEGSVGTGDTVTDGMVFVLSDSSGSELARATAIVKCGSAVEVLPVALSQAPFFPLQVGNEWIYEQWKPTSGTTFITRRIQRAELIGEKVWFVMQESVIGSDAVTETRYRSDELGRIYLLGSNGEILWLDPSPNPNSNARLYTRYREGTLDVPAGTFTNLLMLSDRSVSYYDEGFLARGIGMIYDWGTSLSGVFIYGGVHLVQARIDGNLIYAAPSVSLELTAEASAFDVSNRKAPDCQPAICYVNCGYQPCFRATVRSSQTADANSSVDLDLLDASNASLYHAKLSGTSVAHNVQLYDNATLPFAPGNYKLLAQTPDGRQSVIPIQIK